MFAIKDNGEKGQVIWGGKMKKTVIIVKAEHKIIYITFMQLPVVWHSCDAHEWASAIPVWWEKLPVSGVTNQVAGFLGWTLEKPFVSEIIWGFWLPGGVLLPRGMPGSDSGGGHAHPSGACEGGAGEVPAI